MTKKEVLKVKYLADFEKQLLSINQYYSGKIDWNSALHFYFTGIPLNDAVIKYIDSHKI